MNVLYILYHPSFVAYQTPSIPEVYKLGLTIDAKARLKGYTTAFLGKAEYKYVSKSFASVKLLQQAEKCLFFLLQSQRLANNREFFGVECQRAINVIEQLHALSTNDVDVFTRLFTMVSLHTIPSALREQLRKNEVTTADVLEYITELPSAQFIHEIPYDEFLERYRFRPSNPKMYPNYTLPETQLLLKCLKEDDVSDKNNDINEQSE